MEAKGKIAFKGKNGTRQSKRVLVDNGPLKENGDAIIGAGAPKDRVRVAVAAAGEK